LEDHLPKRPELNDWEIGEGEIAKLNRLGGANGRVLLLAKDGDDGRIDLIGGHYPTYYIAIIISRCC
jgi:hypothetical protein